MKILKEELDENPIDSHYKALMCGLSRIDNTSPDFKVGHFVKLVYILFFGPKHILRKDAASCELHAGLM